MKSLLRNEATEERSPRPCRQMSPTNGKATKSTPPASSSRYERCTLSVVNTQALGDFGSVGVNYEQHTSLSMT